MAGRPALVSKATLPSADDIALDVQAIFGRRRLQPRRPAQAKNAPLKSLAQTGDLYRYMTKVLAPAFD
jgi:hypothetical protein